MSRTATRSGRSLRGRTPRLNGFVWPVVPQLTPSRVEIWIEAVATGELRHYRLPRAAPGEDVLGAFFDRRGFLPAPE